MLTTEAYRPPTGERLGALLGSTSSYLERHGRCSLLVLPRNLLAETTDEEQFADPEDAHEPVETSSGVW